MEDEIEKLALKRFPHTDEGSLADCIYSAKRSIWIEGYNAAQQKGAYSEADISHLKWIYNRLVNVHFENENYDYMLRLNSIIQSLNQESIELERDHPNRVYYDGIQGIKTTRGSDGQLMAYLK